jgi:hypothetical protein
MSKKTLNNSRNSQYQIISFEEQIQNDKERIRRKFNFTNSNNNSFNSSNISDIQSQLSICSKKKNLNNKNEQIIIEKKSEKSSITEIIEEAIGNNKSINNTINRKNNNNINNNTNDDYYNVENSERELEFDIIEKNNKSNNPVNDESILNSNKKMKRIGSSPFLKANNKFSNFLRDNHSNVSALGLLDDEHIIIRNHQEEVSKFKFIHEVLKNNLSYENISIKKFLALDNKCTFNIFSFLYDNFKDLMCTGKKLKNALNLTIKSKYSYIIENFKSKYKDILQFESFKFIQTNTIKLKRKITPIFSIYFKCKIKETPFLQKYEGISYEISYSFKYFQSNKKDNLYYQIYKFDIRKNRNYPIWICSEMDERNYSQRRLVYSSPVQTYCEKDHIILKIDLIEGNNFITDIQFLNVKILSAPKGLFEKAVFRSDIEYDGMRDCEIENMILRWNNENNLIKNSEMLFYIKKTFEKYFIIKEIKYDISKIVFYKIKMKAQKIGLIKRNRIFNLNLEILNEESEITNECINIGCVNTFTQNKVLQIRKGTIIILYITDLKN